MKYGAQHSSEANLWVSEEIWTSARSSQNTIGHFLLIPHTVVWVAFPGTRRAVTYVGNAGEEADN